MTRRSSPRRGPRAGRPQAGGAAEVGPASPADAPAAAAVALEGELTIRTAGDRKAELLALVAGVVRLELDLSAISEIDTAGLQLLLLARREAAAHGAGFEITAAGRAVEEALAIVHLGPALEPRTPDLLGAHR